MIAPAHRFDGLDQKPLFFIHIPKTAGGSLQSFLEDRFNDSEVFQGWNTMDLARASESDLQGKRLFRGHFTAQQAASLSSLELEWMTILREPSNLVRSMYDWIRSLDPETYYSQSENAARQRGKKLIFDQIKSASDMAIIAAQELSFRDYLKSGSPTLGLVRDHLQTKMLCNLDVADPDWWLDKATADEKLCAAKHEALANLKKVQHLGLFERLDSSVALLCWRRGWPYEGLGVRRHRSNWGQNNPCFDAEESKSVKALLPQITNLDDELYRRGQEIFNHQLARFEAAFEKSGYQDHREFLRENHAVSFFEKQTPLETCEVDARQAWPGWGWGPRCRNEHGQVWRLIGPGGKATLLLKALGGKSYWLFLRVFSAPANYDVSKISLRVFDNTPIAPVVSMHAKYPHLSYHLDSSLVDGCGAHLRLTIDTGAEPDEQIALHSLLLIPA